MSPCPAERHARAAPGRRPANSRSGAGARRASGSRARSSSSGLVFALTRGPNRPQTQASGPPFRTCTRAQSRSAPP
eukprot:15462006-Alexandrium_andersonii.AAC.1